MGEYIIDTTGLKKIEVTRCQKCVLHDESRMAGTVFCTIWQRNVPYNGYCYLGDKGGKDNAKLK